MEHTSYTATLIQKIFQNWNIKFFSGVVLSIISFMFDTLQRENTSKAGYSTPTGLLNTLRVFKNKK